MTSNLLLTHLRNGALDEATEIIRSSKDINSHNDNFENTPLHIASEKNYKEIARLLINNGADVNSVNRFGETPLHMAVMMGNIDMEEILVTNGADKGMKNDKGETPYTQTVMLKEPQNQQD